MDLTAFCCTSLLRGKALTKTLRMMKLTAIILLSTCLAASANGYSQKVTISERNATLEIIFKKTGKHAALGSNQIKIARYR